MKTKYIEMRPLEFKEAINKAPIAYLPLGTLEWHGYHMPLGADGLQSENLFEHVAKEVGGVVLPMLFLGPDRIKKLDDIEYYGMDFCTHDSLIEYEDQMMLGSAYYVNDELFKEILLNIAKQLKRAGFKILVAHGHGPSTRIYNELKSEFEHIGLKTINIFGLVDDDKYKYQNDHACANETSLMMVTNEELVDLSILNDTNKIAMAGSDPSDNASLEYGQKILDINIEKIIYEIKGVIKK